MPSDPPTHGTFPRWQIAIGVMTAVAALFGAIATLPGAYNSLFVQPPSTQETQTGDVLPSSDLRAVEELTSRWVKAARQNDVFALVDMATIPFFLNEDIVTTKEELGTRCQIIFASSIDRIKTIKAKRIHQWVADGLDPKSNPILENMGYDDNDIMAKIRIDTKTSNDQEVEFFYRKSGTDWKLAGFVG